MFWLIIALLFGGLYFWLIIGSKTKFEEKYLIFDLLYNFSLIYGVTIAGGTFFFGFLLADIFYLKKKLKNKLKSTCVRFLAMFIIALLLGSIHYILEKVIDVI